MTQFKKPMTAAEARSILEKDPQWVAMMAEKERVRKEREAEYRLAEAPLVDELQAAGFEVQSAWDLVNTSIPYAKALPILLEHLQRPYPAPVREGIARALAVPPANFGWAVFVRLFREEKEKRAKDGLAVAIANTATDSTIDEVIALARDKRLGASRKLLLKALERSRRTTARTALTDLDTDPELHPEVQNILRRINRRRRP